jgi:hypothetical protein
VGIIQEIHIFSSELISFWQRASIFPAICFHGSSSVLPLSFYQCGSIVLAIYFYLFSNVILYFEQRDSIFQSVCFYLSSSVVPTF